jgi:hypothetical protein
MKHFAILSSVLLLHLTSICQPVSVIPGGAGKSVYTAAAATSTNFIIDPEWRITTLQSGAVWGMYGNIKGSAFYKDEWQKGYILLKDKRAANDVSLSFDIYENELFYMKDSQALVLDASIPIVEFGMYDQKENRNNITVFRCGYPSIGRNNERTFYQILSDNKIALMKHYSKSVIESTNLNSAPDKTFFDAENWYVYTANDNRIIPIKKNKNSLEEALPQYSNMIQSIIEQKKLKLKAESDWVALFDEMNKQISK